MVKYHQHALINESSIIIIIIIMHWQVLRCHQHALVESGTIKIHLQTPVSSKFTDKESSNHQNAKSHILPDVLMKESSRVKYHQNTLQTPESSKFTDKESSIIKMNSQRVKYHQNAIAKSHNITRRTDKRVKQGQMPSKYTADSRIIKIYW